MCLLDFRVLQYISWRIKSVSDSCETSLVSYIKLKNDIFVIFLSYFKALQLNETLINKILYKSI